MAANPPPRGRNSRLSLVLQHWDFNVLARSSRKSRKASSKIRAAHRDPDRDGRNTQRSTVFIKQATLPSTANTCFVSARDHGAVRHLYLRVRALGRQAIIPAEWSPEVQPLLPLGYGGTSRSILPDKATVVTAMGYSALAKDGHFSPELSRVGLGGGFAPGDVMILPAKIGFLTRMSTQ